MKAEMKRPPNFVAYMAIANCVSAQNNSCLTQRNCYPNRARQNHLNFCANRGGVFLAFTTNTMRKKNPHFSCR